MKHLKLPLLSLVYLLNTWAFAAVQYECTTQGVPLYHEGRQVNGADEMLLILKDQNGRVSDIIVGEDGDYIIEHKRNSIGVFKKGQESYLLFRVFPTDKAYDLRLPIRSNGRNKEVRCDIRTI